MRLTPDAIDETLLRILPGRAHWTLSHDAIRTAAAAGGSDLVTHLVSHGLATRQEAVKSILEIKGVFGCLVDGELVEARLGRVIPLQTALASGIWPLGLLGTHLYVLAGTLAAVPEVLKLDEGTTLRVLPLGTTDTIEPRIRGCYEVLARLEPARRSFPDYCRAIGILKDAPPLRGRSLADARIDEMERSIPEEKLVQARGAWSDLPVIDERRIRDLADALTLGRIHAAGALPARLLPLRVEQSELWIAADRVPDATVMDALATKLGCRRSRVLLSTPTAIAAAAATVDAVSPAPIPAQANVPTLADRLLLDGVLQHCSDIHIERYQHHVDVRLRKDGNLFLHKTSGVTLMNVQQVVTRLKVDARLDIAETRRPQDGVIRRNFDGRAVDYRVATQPTIWGENMVLRILEQSTPPRLDALGFEEPQLVRLRRLLQSPQGLLLVTGPTGSGKTTTLYAVLQDLRSPEIKILTAENPVEYANDGIQQSQVNDAIGDTFAAFVRAFMRQDPDVILVGEIRDEPTAEAALRAALTGHLVLSTVHANDVFGAVRRLSDLGVEPTMISQTLSGIVGQRIVRRVCEACAEPYQPSTDLLNEFFPGGAPADARFMKGLGCEHCRNTGYSGRTAVLELWTPDDEDRGIIEAQGTAQALRTQAESAGFEPMIQHAARLAAAGVTNLEELGNTLPYEYVTRHAARRMRLQSAKPPRLQSIGG
jgi:type II secretory ATPase GspE/PulE/Tfp pilus assembly ATPase PilB-like protein